MISAPTRPYIPEGKNLWLPSTYRSGHANGLSLPRVDYPLRDSGPNAFLASELPVRKSFKSLCILLFGRRGDGKSAGMNNFLLTQKQRFDRLKQRPEYKNVKNTIFTNYWCEFADVKEPYLSDYIQESPDVRDGEIGYDEIQNSFPNRRALARATVDFGTFLTSLRKRNLNIWMTTQFPRVLDMWILLQIDLFLRCDKFTTPSGGMGIRFRVHDFWGIYIPGNERRRPFPPDPEDYDWEFKIHNAHRVFGKYDTNQEIPSLWDPNREQKILQSGYQFKNPVDPHGDLVAALSTPSERPEEVALTPEQEESRVKIALKTLISLRMVNGMFDPVGLFPSAKRMLPKRVKKLMDWLEWLIENQYELEKPDNASRRWVGRALKA